MKMQPRIESASELPRRDSCCISLVTPRFLLLSLIGSFLVNICVPIIKQFYFAPMQYIKLGLPLYAINKCSSETQKVSNALYRREN